MLCPYNSARGRIASNWHREKKKLVLNITIPANTKATVYVPATAAEAVTESHKPAGRSAEVKFLRQEMGAAVYEVGSGSYIFEANN